MKKPKPIRWQSSLIFFCGVMLTVSCARKASDPSIPSSSQSTGLQERLSGGGGYTQGADGRWMPKSDKRSSFESQRESPYSTGHVKKKMFSTGDRRTKKPWWGSKNFSTKEYDHSGEESRFQGSEARQNGMTARGEGLSARESGTYKTESNRLDGKSARESGSSAVERPLDAAVESRRKVYKAPSVIDWREQRSMSIEQSKGILGR